MPARISVNSHYPYSDKYKFETCMEIINLDEERINDIATGNGFIISAPKAIKDDIKDPNGIFSSKYGQMLQDMNPFANRYKCKCGHRQSKFYNGLVCEVCGEKVKFVDDNFTFFGWICLKDPYYVIHPNLFMSIASLIGQDTFVEILSTSDKKDEDGNSVNVIRTKEEPYRGIGLMDFYDQFDEILSFYASKRPEKMDQYNHIMKNRDKVFTQSIPVFTIHLRPFKLEAGDLHFEDTNAIYNMMAHLAQNINNDRYKMNQKRKPKSQLLFNLQMKYMKLDDYIDKILTGKRGSVRLLFGGRFNFTARNVIAPDSKLRSDQVRLPYPCLCGLLQQTIINILHKTYNMPYNMAYKYLYENMTKPDEKIVLIIDGLIRDSNGGIDVLINRNPTINLGSILAMKCIAINFNYTMSMPENVLTGLAADFDGDTLNVLYIINKEFARRASLAFNPRNSMHISKNDGMFDNDYNQQRDTIINSNTLIQLGRENYTQEMIDKIKSVRVIDK